MKTKIVEEVAELVSCAADLYERFPEISAKVFETSWRIALAVNAKTPKILKLTTCRYCHSFLTPGGSARVRLVDGSVIWYCLKCSGKNRVRRYA